MFEPGNFTGTRHTLAAEKVDPPATWSEIGQTNKV